METIKILTLRQAILLRDIFCYTVFVKILFTSRQQSRNQML